MGNLMGKPDGKKHMGWVQGAGGACRPAGGTDSFPVQHYEQRLPLDKSKAEIHIVGKPLHPIAI